jgi:hypothetical protein
MPWQSPLQAVRRPRESRRRLHAGIQAPSIPAVNFLCCQEIIETRLIDYGAKSARLWQVSAWSGTRRMPRGNDVVRQPQHVSSSISPVGLPSGAVAFARRLRGDALIAPPPVPAPFKPKGRVIALAGTTPGAGPFTGIARKHGEIR